MVKINLNIILTRWCIIKKLILISSLIFCFTFSVYAEKSVFTGLFSSVALKGYDPVAYFTDKKAIKGNPKYMYKWMGAKWYFVSPEHLDMFKYKPDKYAPQYGGWCAYAMAEGSKVGVNPKAFDIIDDKLYLNYNKKVQSKWRKKQESYIKEANKAWEKI